jgi:MFS family permease
MSGTTTDEVAQGSTDHQSRVFWRFWTGSTVSEVGDAVTTVALPLLAVQVLHATTFQVSLLAAAGYVAWIVIGLPAGVIVSRLPLRGTQVGMDLLRAAALASIPVAAALGVLTLAHLVVVALVISLATVVFDVGNSTFLPSIVSKEQLTARNSFTSGSFAAVQVGGPSLGGLLVATVGAVTSLLVDVASYVVSALFLRSLPRPPRQVPTTGAPSAATLIRDGLRFVVRHEVIRPCVVAATLVNFACGALLALTPVFLVRTLDAPTGLVGVLIATEGVGSLVGAAVTTRLATRFGSARTILVASVLGSAMALLMPLATPGWGVLLFAIGNAGFAAGVVVLSILTRTHRQTVVPSDLLPRVMATVRFISWGAIPVGALTAGVAATGLGDRGAFWLVCALTFTAPASLWLSPLRSRRDLA